MEHKQFLADRIRQMRKDQGMTLRQFSQKSGASFSNLSKVETGKLSPTYDTIQKIAVGLGVSVSKLLSLEPNETHKENRSSLTRAGEGGILKTSNYTYHSLCNDVIGKQIVPLFVKIHSNDIKNFGDLLSHNGEEVIYVLKGEIEIHLAEQKPILAKVGDCVFIDSTIGHGLIKTSNEDAEVFWVHLEA